MSDSHRFATSEELNQELANYIAEKLQQDLTNRSAVSLAVSGGRTPCGMFQRLSQCALDWARVTITLVDERKVPVSSADSNERMVREHLLQNFAKSAEFVGLARSGADTLDDIEKELLAMPRPYSVVILGMGSDGHTASWFPGAANLETLLDPVNPAQLAETTPPAAPHRRITQTLSALIASQELVIHITGQDKLDVLMSAQREANPIATLLDQEVVPVSIWWAP
ncbi:MAG: 6-phosphogluconolactonase [Pseudomonadota bacterium]